MAISKAPYSLITKVANNLPATTTTKSNAVLVGTAVDISHYGGGIMWSITNGASAPTAIPAVTIQVSNDGTEWFEYHSVGGDTVANSFNSGTIDLTKGYKQVRAIAYSSTGASTTNAVTVSVQFCATTGL